MILTKVLGSNTISLLPLVPAPKQHQGFAAVSLAWEAGGLYSIHQAHRYCTGGHREARLKASQKDESGEDQILMSSQKAQTMALANRFLSR